MYVCICKAVTARQITEAVENGAKNLKAVQKCTGVASQCGKCAYEAQNIVNLSLKTQEKEGFFGNAYPAL